ncbi:phage major capsid protein [Salmonella phage SPFM12]|nr:phage major capsid protein [Salmonella phage SPFM12]
MPAYPTNYLSFLPYVMETGENAKFFVSEDIIEPLHNALSNHKVLQDDAIRIAVTRGILNALLTKDVVEDNRLPTITVDTNDVGITVRTKVTMTWTLNVRALETQSKFAETL